MKKIKSIFFKKIITIIISLIIVFSVFVGILGWIIRDNKVYEVQEISNGWNIEYNNTSLNNVNILNYNFYGLKKGQIIEATKVLSKEDFDIIYPVLDVTLQNGLIEVYVDNKMVYGNISGDKKEYAKQNFTILLPQNYDKKKVKIKFEIEDDDAEKILENIYIISENDYVNYQIRSNLLTYLVSSVILILGMILVLSVICIPKKNSNIRRLLWIGGTFLFAGLAMYSNYDILDLYINNSKIVEFVRIMGISFLIPSIFMLGYEMFKVEKHKKYIITYNVILVVIFIGSVVLNEMNLMQYRDINNIYVLMLYVAALMMIILGIINYKRVESIDKIALIGLILVFAQGMITILLYKILSKEVWDEKGEIFIVAMIFEFFIAMIIHYAYVVKEHMNNITEQRILSTLAYTDPLTGIMNRTKYEEVVECIKCKPVEQLIVISFDLNNLKKINDNKGHEAGDIYIKEFTNSLKKSFEDHGFVCRIGGDEFVAIIENKIIDISKQIEKMQKIFFDGMQNKKCEFEASFAYGYADSNYDNSNDINELISLADERMYACKKEQKMGRE